MLLLRWGASFLSGVGVGGVGCPMGGIHLDGGVQKNHRMGDVSPTPPSTMRSLVLEKNISRNTLYGNVRLFVGIHKVEEWLLARLLHILMTLI